MFQDILCQWTRYFADNILYDDVSLKKLRLPSEPFRIPTQKPSDLPFINIDADGNYLPPAGSTRRRKRSTSVITSVDNALAFCDELFNQSPMTEYVEVIMDFLAIKLYSNKW